MGNCYSLYSKNLGMSGKMVWWSTEPNWSTKLGDLSECLKLTLDSMREKFKKHLDTEQQNIRLQFNLIYSSK